MKAFLAFLAMTVAANAECLTSDEIKKSLLLVMPTVTFTELGELGTQLFLLNLNAAFPNNGAIADRIIVADKPTAPRLAVVYFIKDCYAGEVFPLRAEYENIMGHKL